MTDPKPPLDLDAAYTMIDQLACSELPHDEWNLIVRLVDEVERLREALDEAGVTLHRHVTHGLTRNDAHEARDKCFKITRAALEGKP